MFSHALQRNVRILSSAQAEKVLEAEPDVWNVIHVPHQDHMALDLSLAKSSFNAQSRSSETFQALFGFCTDSKGPLLVCCASGVTNSPTILLLILLHASAEPHANLLSAVRSTRPIARFNLTLLKAGLAAMQREQEYSQLAGLIG